ncbi:NAD(P)/FAD-dependent oxidoreductase [Desertimonas flava]|uniref:NAD(P)/FAD-dependent oxidoreductase n=1 Tax=Desertimonas flava TaxID=2064846 RepID=UPI0013C51F41|nr:NAD(P)/FAD-dependent oxidoreductase [Desertimonas flava]
MPNAAHSPDVDVLVVGGGPAGVAAGITARRAGLDVAIVDKAVFPRDKCCGDGLTTLALRELEAIGFQPESVPSFQVVDGADIRAPGGRTVTVPLPTGRGVFAAVTPRIELDAALVELAVAEGVTVHQGSAVKDVTPIESVVLVDCEGLGVVRARHVIAADGMWSPVRKALGLNVDGYLGEWHAFRQYVSGVTGAASKRLIVWFDEDFLPGYAWSFPLPDGRANVGFGILRATGRRTQDMKATWAGFFDRPHIAAALGPDAAPEGRHQAWPIPARIDSATLSSGRTLFVGDAAGATDLMTGEGIGQALLTGRLAAEAIAANPRGEPAATAARYERAVRHDLVADHRMSVLLGRVLAHRRGADGSVAILDHAGSWGRRNFARWMFEDEPRSIITTPRRWHRRFLDRPGAFRTAFSGHAGRVTGPARD